MFRRICGKVEQGTSRWLPGVLAIVLWLACVPVLAAAPPDTGASSLDTFAKQAMQTFDTPGMAVVIVDGDKTSTHAYGVRKLGSAALVDAHTIFPLGSNTKAFTTAALAILVDEGKLRWDDRVVDKLPGFRMYDPYASSEMTVTDLLVHRSGLGLGQGDLMFVPTTNRSRTELVHAIRYLKPARSFRGGYDYDNVLYTVAGQLIEAVSGQRWEDFIQQRVLNPLDMHDTQVSIDARVEDQVTLHAKTSGPMRGVGAQSVQATIMTGDVFAPAGALSSSASDMAHWLHVQLAHGAMDNGKRLFTEAASTALWTPQTLIPIRPAPPELALAQPQFQAYALGLEVSDYRGHKIVTHLGGVLGGISAVVIMPDRNAAFAIMLNSEDVGTLFAMREHLLDSYLGLSSPDWIANYRKVFDQANAKALKSLAESKTSFHPEIGPSLKVSSYAGIYRDPWYGTVTISQAKRGLRIDFDRSPGMHGALEHVQYDTFRTHFDTPGLEDAYVTFSLAADGTVDTIKMAPVSPVADFSWDYQDLHFTPEKKDGGGK